MPTEMGAEAVEMVTMAVDKFQATNNYEVRVIKEEGLSRTKYSNTNLILEFYITFRLRHSC